MNQKNMTKKQIHEQMMSYRGQADNWDFIISAYRAAVEDNQGLMYNQTLLKEVLTTEYKMDWDSVMKSMQTLHEKKKQEHEEAINGGNTEGTGTDR